MDTRKMNNGRIHFTIERKKKYNLTEENGAANEKRGEKMNAKNGND